MRTKRESLEKSVLVPFLSPRGLGSGQSCMQSKFSMTRPREQNLWLLINCQFLINYLQVSSKLTYFWLVHALAHIPCRETCILKGNINQCAQLSWLYDFSHTISL